MILQQILLVFLFGITTLLFLFSSRYGNKSKGLYVILVSAMVILVIFRPSSMADYEDYTYAFNTRTSVLRFEPTFIIIKSIARLFSNTTIVGLSLYALLSIVIRSKIIFNSSPAVFASLLVYLSNVYIAQDMIAIRAALATAFLLCALYFKSNDKQGKSFLCFFIACLSHYSSIITLPLIFVNKVKPRFVLYFGGLLISAIIAYQGFGLSSAITLVGFAPIQSLFDMYENQSEINIFNFLQYGRILICLFCWHVYFKNAHKIERDIYEINPLIILKAYTYGLILAFLFSDLITLSVRFSELLISVEVLLIPIYFSVYFKRSLIFKFWIIVYSILIFYFSLTNTAYFLV